MPTQDSLEALHSEKEIKNEKTSDMSENEALAVEKKNSSVMPEPMQDDMTRAEALAILWTGVEALARMKVANLYHSPKTGRVVIELLAVEYSPTKGIVSVGNK